MLRSICRNVEETELKDAIVRAVRKDAEWLSTVWGKQFERALDLGTDDFFAQEKCRSELLALVATSPTPHARASCEIALGLLARDDVASPQFKTVVMKQAVQAFAVDSVELLSSLVAAGVDDNNAAQVRRRLHGLLSNCDFSREPPQRAIAEALSVEAGLDLPLKVSL